MKCEKLREKLIAILQNLKKAGYTCYLTKRSDEYGYIITPRDNVMCIWHGWYGGWGFSFSYKQSSRNGTGCQCLDYPVDDVTIALVQQAEQEGGCFAARLGAAFHKSSTEFFRSYWDKENLVEI